MSFNHPTDLKNSPYFDDFSEEKQFLQILFKPGYAVQARELTQLQTILQNQISKVSDHLFTDGSRIYGGEASVGTYFFARVKTNSIKDSNNNVISFNELTYKNYFYNTLTQNFKSFVPIRVKINDQSYGSDTPNVALDETYRNSIFNLEEDFQIQLIDILPYTPAYDEIIIIFKFVKGSLEKLNKFKISNTDKLILREVTSFKNADGDYVGNYSSLKAIRPPDNTNVNPISFEFIPKILINNILYLENFNTCQVAFIEEGIYYKDGKFVKNPKTIIPIYKMAQVLSTNMSEIESTMYSGLKVLNITGKSLENRRLFSYQSKKIGYAVVPQTVNFVQDTSLLDNASGFLNERAPGADRLKYNLVPTQIDFDDTSVSSFNGNNFIEVARLKRGQLLFAKRNTEYAEILKLFARRTFDESGSYTVRPFPVEFKEHLREDEYTLNFTSSFNSSLVEVGDLIFATGDVNPVLRLAKLVKPNTDRSSNPTLVYPIEITTEPIGIVKKIETYKVIVTGLNKVSFNSLEIGASISIKKSDDNQFVDIGNLNGTNTQIEYFYDEKGVYLLSSEEIGDENKFVASMGQGKGYVEGFEIETLYPHNLTLDKARETASTLSDINVLLENKVILSADASTLFPTTTIQDNLMEEQLTIRANSLLVQIEFTGLPFSGIASALLFDFTPFEITNLLRPSLPDINVRNKQSVLLCDASSQSAPSLP